MLPSLFSLQQPVTAFHVLFGIYAYLLPILLYAMWASLSLMDLSITTRADGRAGWCVAVLLVPLIGGAYYLLARATMLSRRARYAAVGAGLLAWLVPLAYGLPLVWGPLGPKAL